MKKFRRHLAGLYCRFKHLKSHHFNRDNPSVALLRFFCVRHFCEMETELFENDANNDSDSEKSIRSIFLRLCGQWCRKNVGQLYRRL